MTRSLFKIQSEKLKREINRLSFGLFCLSACTTCRLLCLPPQRDKPNSLKISGSLYRQSGVEKRGEEINAHWLPEHHKAWILF